MKTISDLSKRVVENNESAINLINKAEESLQTNNPDYVYIDTLLQLAQYNQQIASEYTFLMRQRFVLELKTQRGN